MSVNTGITNGEDSFGFVRVVSMHNSESALSWLRSAREV